MARRTWTQQEEDDLTPEELAKIKDDMLSLASRLENLAVRLQAPARMNMPMPPENPAFDRKRRRP